MRLTRRPTCSCKLTCVPVQPPHKLVPFHIECKAPSYFIVGGLVFTAVTVPYLRSEYGAQYDMDAPVKLLNTMMHSHAKSATDQVVVVSQVLASDINIGYEDIMNTQVRCMTPRVLRELHRRTSACVTCAHHTGCIHVTLTTAEATWESPPRL